MSTTEPSTASSNGTPPPSAPADDLAGLDERTRTLVEHYVARANDASGEAGRYRHELRSLQAEHERLQREHESEQERIVREAEARGRTAAQTEHAEVVAGYERRLATSAILARAAGRFADPQDAVRMLDVDALLAEPDEAKRAQKTEAALSKLLEQKPYLARDSRERGPLVSQGPRSTPPEGRTRERSWLRG